MRHTRPHVQILLALALLVPVAPALAQAPPTTTAPAKDKPIDDAWLGDAVIDQLAATPPADLPKLNNTIQAAMFARMCCGHVDQLAALNDMMYALKAAVYLPEAAKAAGDEKLGAWLLAHRPVARLLFRALGEVRDREGALKRMGELVSGEEAAVAGFPELAVAFATAEPLAHYTPQPQAASTLEAFRWFARGGARFRFDLKTMPYELSRYLADTRLSLAERQWATDTYRATPNLAKRYFDVDIDRQLLKPGGKKRVLETVYSLPNIKTLGGDPMEQAYFAAEVCKAHGLPATIIVGKAESGFGHAWLGFLDASPDGKQAQWDAQTGRYREHHFYGGVFRDPASGQLRTEAELLITADVAQLLLARREEADSAVILANLVDQVRDKFTQADVKVLEQLADAYDRRQAAGPPNPAQAASDPVAAKADRSWIGQERKLDEALVAELLDAAIERNLAHRPAWELLLGLRRRDRLPQADLQRYLDVLVTRTAGEYPDYTCLMLVHFVPTIKEPAEREKAYRRAMQVFARRADLRGRCQIALADDLRDRGEKDQALQLYEQAALQNLQVAETVITAAARAEAVLLEQDRRDVAIKFYTQLFQRTKKSSSPFRAHTANYQIGARLAALLRQAGNVRAAEQVERGL